MPMIQSGEGNSVSANKGSSFIRNKNFRGCTLSAPPGFKMLRYHSMLLSIGECNLHHFKFIYFCNNEKMDNLYTVRIHSV